MGLSNQRRRFMLCAAAIGASLSAAPWQRVQAAATLLPNTPADGLTRKSVTKTLLNGAAVPFHQIGTDLSRMNAPVPLQRLVPASGERADLLVDFSGQAGWRVTLPNRAATPFPGGANVVNATAPKLMVFDAMQPLNAAILRATLPARTCHDAAPALIPRPTPTAAHGHGTHPGSRRHANLRPMRAPA